MIATLPMYDSPPLRAAHDRLWAAIRATLGQGPAVLTRGGDLWDIWQSPDLLLGQTCGMPYRKKLHGHVTLVAAPDHGLDGLSPGTYHSVIVSRADDPKPLAEMQGARLAVNDALSQSGWSAPMRYLEAWGRIPHVLPFTGSHVASARAVADGRADLAGLDCVTWNILMETDPALTAKLTVRDRTEPSPALPFITAKTRDPAPLHAALGQAIASLSHDDRQQLRLQGVILVQPQDYLSVPDPVTDAAGLST